MRNNKKRLAVTSSEYAFYIMYNMKLINLTSFIWRYT